MLLLKSVLLVMHTVTLQKKNSGLQQVRVLKTLRHLSLDSTLLDFQDELALSLKVLQDKVESLKLIQKTSADLSKYIKVM